MQVREHVHGMANIGGGRGRCNFCDSECRDTRTHECGILFQISIIMGHTFQPEHFLSCRKPQRVRAAKIPKFDTVPVMLNKPCQPIEAPEILSMPTVFGNSRS